MLLLLRFDLFFILVDECNKVTDYAIARKIVDLHTKVTQPLQIFRFGTSNISHFIANLLYPWFSFMWSIIILLFVPSGLQGCLNFNFDQILNEWRLTIPYWFWHTTVRTRNFRSQNLVLYKKFLLAKILVHGIQLWAGPSSLGWLNFIIVKR